MWYVAHVNDVCVCIYIYTYASMHAYTYLPEGPPLGFYQPTAAMPQVALGLVRSKYPKMFEFTLHSNLGSASVQMGKRCYLQKFGIPVKDNCRLPVIWQLPSANEKKERLQMACNS